MLHRESPKDRYTFVIPDRFSSSTMDEPERGTLPVSKKMTPAMTQYWSIKDQHRDAILLFHIGDFYETFGADAEILSRELDIALTSRGKDSSGNKIPLAGVPCHAVEGYIARLIGKGYRVAICDQVEDAKNAKGVVRREVVRVITPGTLIDEGLLPSPMASYLMAVCSDVRSPDLGLAFLDISTGEFFVTSCRKDDKAALVSELQRYRPAEGVIPAALAGEVESILGKCGVVVTREKGTGPLPEDAEAFLKEHFRVEGLEGYGITGNSPVVTAAALALRYARETQRLNLSHIRGLSFRQPGDFCVIDSVTIRNLEILQSIRGRSGDPTLLSLLDLTNTPMGYRLLRQWLSAPLVSVEMITLRLDAVEFFTRDTPARLHARKLMAKAADIERIAGRIACRNASPRDLLALSQTLSILPSLRSLLDGTTVPSAVQTACSDLGDVSWIVSLIHRAITDDPPAAVRLGGVFRNGYDERLDTLRSRSSKGKEWIVALQNRERECTGIRSLKVGYNSVFGYYIEVTRPNLHLVPPGYERKQTTSTGERYTLPELKEEEAAIATAEERLFVIEQELYTTLLSELGEGLPLIQAVSRGLATLDLHSSLAEVAVRYRYTRPVLDTSTDIMIREGRHPVVEASGNVTFVPNDTTLSGTGEQILIITGANMAGKSTYMRAVALIVLMAQAGSYVPAAHARIGVVDRIFSRVGAFDDLASGQSTFMVEMLELANILNNVTPRSLVILDEIGRGTSTLDGYCIARSVLEYLHGRGRAGARTLFATHFHDIVSAESELKRVRNYHFAVRDTGNEITFLRRLIPGATDRSYGIHVASLAGVPAKVTDRASAILQEIMAGESGPAGRVQRYTQMLLIDAPAASPDPLIQDIRDLDPDSMTPREALDTLYDLHQRAGGRKGRGP